MVCFGGNGLINIMNELIKTYVEKGIHQNKLIVTDKPSVCVWSLSKKCLVGKNEIETLEIIDGKVTVENNRMVFLLVRSELTNDDINEINNSSGIIITDAVYEKHRFRYGFIPTI